ncbi:serine/threonine-protein phosphatase 7 long form homolog [Quercus suber]|uniref:serine/threonine-protein phosphatase 7 long form homolog n=1 Tax=Quercus suber TaxID=58331 RepID=UPI0032DEB2B8
MVDEHVIAIVRLLGVEHLHMVPSIKFDYALITAFVEQWHPKTHSFHLPHGEMTITLQDVEVIMGMPIESEAMVGFTKRTWKTMYANELQVHQYAHYYVLALLGDMVFVDKSRDRVHLMWLEFMENLHNSPKYSWGSAVLSWLYRQLCKATKKTAKQIGGALILVQLWIFARFSHMSPQKVPPAEGVYGPPPPPTPTPLAMK